MQNSKLREASLNEVEGNLYIEINANNLFTIWGKGSRPETQEETHEKFTFQCQK